MVLIDGTKVETPEGEGIIEGMYMGNNGALYIEVDMEDGIHVYGESEVKKLTKNSSRSVHGYIKNLLSVIRRLENQKEEFKMKANNLESQSRLELRQVKPAVLNLMRRYEGDEDVEQLMVFCGVDYENMEQED